MTIDFLAMSSLPYFHLQKLHFLEKKLPKLATLILTLKEFEISTHICDYSTASKPLGVQMVTWATFQNRKWTLVKLMFQTWGLKYPNVLKRYYDKSFGIFQLTLNGPETSCLQEKRKEFFLLLLDPCQFISRHHLSHGA